MVDILFIVGILSILMVGVPWIRSDTKYFGLFIIFLALSIIDILELTL